MRENGGWEGGGSEKHCFLLGRGDENFPALKVPSQCPLIFLVGTEGKIWKVVFITYFPYFEKNKRFMRSLCCVYVCVSIINNF
jgi:hypothetical protein